MASLSPKYRQMTVAVKYNTVLFPFDAGLFLKAISKQGYILPESFGPIPLGTRLNVNGVVGRKGGVSLGIDMDRQVVAVHAEDLGDLVDEMKSIEAMLSEEFVLDSESIVDYYEFGAGLTVKTKRNPLQLWADLFGATPLLKSLSDVLGTGVSPFGLRLTPAGQIANQTSWLEVKIEPQILSPTSHHGIEVIYRNRQRADVFAFIRKFDAMVIDLIAKIEQG